MKKNIIIGMFTLFLFATPLKAATMAATAVSTVKVYMISLNVGAGQVLLQTTPRHSIAGTACTDDYWLILDTAEAGYSEAYSALLTAQATNSYIQVTAIDSAGAGYCHLSRIISLN